MEGKTIASLPTDFLICEVAPQLFLSVNQKKNKINLLSGIHCIE